MAGRQRLQQGEERAEPVGALLGIGPGSLPPLPSFSLLLQSCSRSPLPKQGCPTAPQARRCHQNFAGSGRSHGRSSKASDVPMCGHAGPSPSPPLPLSSPRATVATLPRAPAPGHPSRNLPWPKDAQGSRQLAGTGGNSLLPPPPPPRTPKHNPCRNTASTRPAQAETMIFCFCFLSLPIPSRQGKAAPWPPSGRAAAGGGERKKPGN